MSKKRWKNKRKKKDEPPNTEPDWTKNCENCGATPIVPFCGLCGPCCFGEADTANGNW